MPRKLGYPSCMIPNAALLRRTALVSRAVSLSSIALCIGLVWALANYRVLFRYTYIFGLSGVVLLALPFVPFLNGGGNAVVWISIFGFNFQPGEIAKICLAIFFAGSMRESSSSADSGFSPPAATAAAAAGSAEIRSRWRMRAAK